MRIDDLDLERYGGFERLRVDLGPGLTVVLGPNEAGKSTLLCAIRDLLYRFPERSPQVAGFGSDAARVGATLVASDGTSLTLRRRHGRGRTLLDADGRSRDEGALSPLLGSVGRARFATLFGLDHHDLRRGGDELLRADGDVGRLVVEAGGGLLSLMRRLDALEAEVDGLFAPRRKEGRAFYRALSAYEAADRGRRAASLTREAYERDVAAHEAAVAAVAGLRSARRELGEELSALRRAERVAPVLRRLDRAEADAVARAEGMTLSHDFPDRCDALLSERAAASARVAEARERLADAERRLAAVVVDEGVREAEADVRDLVERAAVVRAGRTGGEVRREELRAAEAQLAHLRDRVGADPRYDVGRTTPSPATVRQVRALAARAVALRTSLEGARRALDLAEAAAREARARLDASAAGGLDVPFGVGVAPLATLPAEHAYATSRCGAADRALGRASERAVALGFRDARAALAMTWPSARQVEVEAEARTALSTERARLAAERARAEADRLTAEAEVEALRAAGEVATPDLLVAARRRRDVCWADLRSSFLGEGPPSSSAERRAVAERLERRVAEADHVADRRVVEAKRVAAIAQARRRAGEAAAVAASSGRGEARLDRSLGARREAFRRAFPDACDMVPEIDAMLAVAAGRAGVAEDVAAADEARDEAEAALARISPSLALLEWVERRAGLEGAGDDLLVRVQVATEAAAAHDAKHADHARHASDLVGFQAEASEAEAVWSGLEAEREAWAEAWTEATATIGLPADSSPDEAVDLVDRWGAARGHVAAATQARRALARVEADEAELARRAAALAARLGLDPAVDPLALAETVARRWAENDAALARRGALAAEAEAAATAVGAREVARARVEAALSELSASASLPCEPEVLAEAATRRRALDASLAEVAALSRGASDVGDGLPTARLREQVGGRDLDSVRAEAADVASRLADVNEALEAAVVEERRSAAVLDGHGLASGDAVLIAEREGAVADMHDAVERYVELRLARNLVLDAIRVVREERQVPLVEAAGTLFRSLTDGEFAGLAADVDDRGEPLVVGVRSRGRGTRAVATMSEGTRDGMYLAFRLAAVSDYCASAEPLPMLLDDVLVSFDDRRTEAALGVLAEVGRLTQVVLFTHHRSVAAAAATLAAAGRASVVELGA